MNSDADRLATPKKDQHSKLLGKRKTPNSKTAEEKRSRRKEREHHDKRVAAASKNLLSNFQTSYVDSNHKKASEEDKDIRKKGKTLRASGSKLSNGGFSRLSPEQGATPFYGQKLRDHVGDSGKSSKDVMMFKSALADESI